MFHTGFTLEMGISSIAITSIQMKTLDYCASVRGSNEDAALRLVIIVDLDHLINDEQ